MTAARLRAADDVAAAFAVICTVAAKFVEDYNARMVEFARRANASRNASN